MPARHHHHRSTNGGARRSARSRRRVLYGGHGPEEQETGPELPTRLGPPLLPDPVSILLGRDGEVSEVRELLARSPVLTLTGPPGVGKSRLAAEVASRLNVGGPAGAVIVGLGWLTDPAQVGPAVAEALLRLKTASPGNQDPDQAIVVILDDCDRVLTECAQVAHRLQSHGVRVLATARERLGADGEAVWRVPPLSLPRPGGDELPDVFTDSGAVQLFCDRAASAHRGFLPDPGNAHAIAAICRRLDGIPLALELAARSVAAYSLTDVAAHLDDPFPLLSGGTRTAHPRHQSMWASLAWSYDVLSDSERVAFDRLGVFPGSFTREAASAVCGYDGFEEAQVSEILRDLVEKSLLEVEIGRGRTRYRFLHVVRRFAMDQLAASGELDDLQAGHARWCVKAVEDAGDARSGRPWMQRLLPYDDDIRAALDWAIESGWGEGAVVLAEAGFRLCRVQERYREARQRIDQVVAEAASAPALRAGALAAAGMTKAEAGDLAGAVALLEESLAAARDAGDAVGTARAEMSLAFLRVLSCGHPPLVAALEAAVGHARETASRSLVVDALAASGHAHLLVGSPGGAHEDFSESLELAGRDSDEVGQAHALVGLGGARMALGRYDDGEAALRQGLELARAAGEVQAAAEALVWLGESARLQGGAGVAESWFRQAADLAGAADHPSPKAMALIGLGRVGAGHDDPAAARAHFEAALATADAVSYAVASCLCGLAEVAVDASTARLLVGRALSAAQRCGDKAGEALAFEHFARLSQVLGDLRGAASRHRQALVLRARIGDPAAIASSFEALARLAAAREDHVIAARLMGASEALRERIGCVRVLSQNDEHASAVQSVLHAVGEEAFDVERQQGAALSLKAATAFAARHGGRSAPRPTAGWEALTGAERTVAEAAVRGGTNAEIARELGIAATTVKAHLRSVYAKVGVETRTALASSLHREGER